MTDMDFFRKEVASHLSSFNLDTEVMRMVILVFLNRLYSIHKI